MYRFALCVLCCTILPGIGAPRSHAQAATPSLPLDPALGISTIRLWNGPPPTAGNTLPAAPAASASIASAEPTIPTLTIFQPHMGRANGTAIVIAPGGAYLGLAANLEGRQVADWFAARGVTAFVLKYRLGVQNPYPIPLKDAQRAMRLVRSESSKYGIAPNRIGMIGFSAGGHLSAMTATSFDDGNPASPDPVERVSDRPDFLILGYPWLNAMQPNDKGMINYCSVLKGLSPEFCKSLEQPYTPSLHVTAKTPPTFIYSTTEDELVPVSASVGFYNALLAAGVSVEMHLFAHGKHGSGLGSGDPALDLWPVLLEPWLRGQGLLPPRPTPEPHS